MPSSPEDPGEDLQPDAGNLEELLARLRPRLERMLAVRLDPRLARRIASEAGIKGDTVDRAWSDPSYEEKLETQQRMAAAIGVTGIPTFVVGEKYVLEGAVPLELLIHAATEALKDP